jgi:hypothetical protein
MIYIIQKDNYEEEQNRLCVTESTIAKTLNLPAASSLKERRPRALLPLSLRAFSQLASLFKRFRRTRLYLNKVHLKLTELVFKR